MLLLNILRFLFGLAIGIIGIVICTGVIVSVVSIINNSKMEKKL